MKTATIEDILQTEAAQKRALQLYKTCAAGTFAKTICAELIEPHIDAINQRIGQENVPLFLAYAVENALNQASSPVRKGASGPN